MFVQKAPVHGWKQWRIYIISSTSPCSFGKVLGDDGSSLFSLLRSRNEFVAAATVIKPAPTIPSGVNSSPKIILANIAPIFVCVYVPRVRYEKTCDMDFYKMRV